MRSGDRWDEMRREYDYAHQRSSARASCAALVILAALAWLAVFGAIVLIVWLVP